MSTGTSGKDVCGRAGLTWRLGSVVAIALFAVGCGGDNGATARTFAELYVPDVDTFTTHREVDCPGGQGERRCERPTGVSIVQYGCGERSLYVATRTGTAFPLDADLDPSRVDVRGHAGMLAFVDTGDPILTWREAPRVWVQIGTEDLSLFKARVLKLATSLRRRGWDVEDARDLSGSKTPRPEIGACAYFFE